MDYFNRRHRPSTEYSGHEEASSQLRTRLQAVFREYVTNDGNGGSYYIGRPDVNYVCTQHLLTSDVANIFVRGNFEDAFALTEIIHDLSKDLAVSRRNALHGELREAFRLSGSVYRFESGRVSLIPTKELAAKLTAAEPVLSPYQKSYVTFYNAVGDLMGRKRKPDDIVKDLFVGAEGYLKAITGANDYGYAVKELGKKGALNSIQRAVMDKLYGYRSDAAGVGHAGNTEAPTETDALWFLETMLAQLSHIDRKRKGQPVK